MQERLYEGWYSDKIEEIETAMGGSSSRYNGWKMGQISAQTVPERMQTGARNVTGKIEDWN